MQSPSRLDLSFKDGNRFLGNASLQQGLRRTRPVLALKSLELQVKLLLWLKNQDGSSCTSERAYFRKTKSYKLQCTPRESDGSSHVPKLCRGELSSLLRRGTGNGHAL